MNTSFCFKHTAFFIFLTRWSLYTCRCWLDNARSFTFRVKYVPQTANCSKRVNTLVESEQQITEVKHKYQWPDNKGTEQAKGQKGAMNTLGEWFHSIKGLLHSSHAGWHRGSCDWSLIWCLPHLCQSSSIIAQILHTPHWCQTKTLGHFIWK